MKKVSIALTGYYGFSNLGDDILLLCTYNLIRHLLPDAEISIITASKQAAYVSSLIGSPAAILSSADSKHFDLIVHGGGGVHFDFKKAGIKYLWLNRFIKLIGIKNFRLAFSHYKKLKKHSGITTDKRIGIGIGVGTFTPASQKFYSNIQVLADYDLLFVRDENSLQNVKRYNFSYPVFASSDLAFLRKHWMPDLPARKNVSTRKIGIVLRDWPYDNNQYFEPVEKCCQELEKKGFEITCYALDTHSDSHFIARFARSYEVVVWNPEAISIQDYLLRLQQEAVLVSSRAHGAIVGACLGIPVICLGIETKLETVAGMLQQSAGLVNMPINAALLENLILDRFQNLQSYREHTLQDTLNNEAEIGSSVAILEKFLAAMPWQQQQ